LGTTNGARKVLVSGATGYLGSRLVRRLVERGHDVRALARQGSEAKVPEGARVVTGDALRTETYIESLARADTLVHLVGVAHPSPAKAPEFLAIDLASAQAAFRGARNSGVRHIVYVSVARPAPVMRSYVAARAEAERVLGETRLPATVLRPWYVLGPGHYWPIVLLPLYLLSSCIPGLRSSAQRLGLVTITQMLAALVHAVEHPVPEGTRVLDVPGIRKVSR
jgi:uncharacterized protein YbjT (DUF2867 family)